MLQNLFLVLALVSAYAPFSDVQPRFRYDVPILHMNVDARPARAAVGEQITYQAWVYSTSDITETMYITATVEPYQRLAVSGTVVAGVMAPTDCDPTLRYLACRIKIKRGYPASIYAGIDAPLLGTCDQRVLLRVQADLPDRHNETIIPVELTHYTHCYHFPRVVN